MPRLTVDVLAERVDGHEHRLARVEDSWRWLARSVAGVLLAGIGALLFGLLRHP